jgi:hypothetical protein
VENVGSLTHLRGVLHLFLSWARPVQSTPAISPRSIVLLSSHLRLGLPSDVSVWLHHQYSIHVPLLPHSYCMPRPPFAHRLDHSNYTWRRVQITKLLVMQCSPPSHHFSGQNILLRILFPNTFSLRSSLNGRCIKQNKICCRINELEPCHRRTVLLDEVIHY